MKKVTLLALTFIGMLAITSCKKDYTCECVTSGGGGSIKTSSTINDTRKAAKESCDKNDSEILGVTTECELE